MIDGNNIQMNLNQFLATVESVKQVFIFTNSKQIVSKSSGSTYKEDIEIGINFFFNSMDLQQ